MENKYLNESFLSRWVSGSLSDDEKREFNEWLSMHSEYGKMFDEIRMIWEQAGKISFPVDNKEIAWEKIRNRIGQTAPEKRHHFIHSRRRLFQWAIPAAASILIMIGLYYFMQQDTITVKSPNGQVAYVTLPDSSEVILNAGSQITYPVSGWDNGRRVEMNGEAYFKIRKNKNSFLVKSDLVSIEVLGTEFNVKTRHDKTEVICSEGKVRVESEYRPREPVILTAGLGTYILEEAAPVKPFAVNTDKKSGWINGELVFEQEPLHSVFEEIERQYNVTIQTDMKDAGQKFTGRLTKSRISESLDLICLIAGISYTKINDSTYTIHK